MLNTTDLDRDDERAIEFAREVAFRSFLDDRDEDRANVLFTHMVAVAFARHFHTGEPRDDEAADQVAEMANTKLAEIKARYRLVRVR